MSDNHIITSIDREKHLARLHLNRPEKKNALSTPMMNRIIADLKTIAEDKDIKTVVFTAEGDSFCSGLDLHDLRADNDRELRYGRSESTREITQLMRMMPQVTVSIVRGWCLGGGLALVCASDLAIAAESAQLGMPEILRGSYGEVATPTLFHSKVPLKVAFHIQLTGRNLSGLEAFRVGLVSEVVPDDELENAQNRLVTELALRSRVALTHAKIAAYTQVDLPFPQAMLADEVIGHRQRFYSNPLNEVDSYLKSQKGGGDTNYRRSDEA